VENYFTDSLLYIESEEDNKESSPDDDDSNEADFEYDPILLNKNLCVAYLDESPCNDNTVDDDDEWVLNENVAFEYPVCIENVNSSLSIDTFHMPTLTSMEACMTIEDEEGVIFVVPSHKKDQSPIIFSKA
jgi:hypothetical protein